MELVVEESVADVVGDDVLRALKERRAEPKQDAEL